MRSKRVNRIQLLIKQFWAFQEYQINLVNRTQ